MMDYLNLNPNSNNHSSGLNQTKYQILNQKSNKIRITIQIEPNFYVKIHF